MFLLPPLCAPAPSGCSPIPRMATAKTQTFTQNWARCSCFVFLTPKRFLMYSYTLRCSYPRFRTPNPLACLVSEHSYEAARQGLTWRQQLHTTDLDSKVKTLRVHVMSMWFLQVLQVGSNSYGHVTCMTDLVMLPVQ